MKSVVLKYGLIAGAIAALALVINVPLFSSGTVNMDTGQILGYTGMVLAFITIFFGIRAYREQNGGVITFGRAVAIGLLITLVASAIYVVTWEVIYYGFANDFVEQYTTHLLEEARAEGQSATETRELEAEMKRFAELYDNPAFNVLITFAEIFPVGLVITLVAAVILRRREPAVSSDARPV